MSETPGPTTPTLVSLLICDQVIDDKLTNKKSAIGIFNMIMTQQMPAAIHHMAILVSLTEIAGRTELELRLVRDSDNQVMFSGKGAVDAPNPLAIADILFGLQGVRIPEAGQYAIELWGRGELLGRRRFQVLLRPPGQQGQQGHQGPQPGPPPPGPQSTN